MVEPEATQSPDAPASASPAADWSHVRGFQVLAAAGAAPEGATEDAGARAELAKELGARAARFTQSVDDSIVLASDGLIRWLGDPVARLIAGDDLLKPRAVLLADEALSSESRQAVQTRLDLWIAAHVSKVLGPLEALADPGAAVAEPVRALAARIAQALGVLERDRVRQQVKVLDQSARSALRKLGVRFGSMYIFVPALLKPGARTLCSQLWGLRRGEAGVERLLAFAAAGRTSFAAEAPLAADTYRVAGFRLCGDRVVRIDIVERLNDLIRAAIPDHMRPGGHSASEASGFVVSPQMTSLTGCAGDSFASILRSLGYESHRVKKSDFEAATRKPTASLEPIAAPAVAAEADAGEVVGHAEPGPPDGAPESGDLDVPANFPAEGEAESAIEPVQPPTAALSTEPEPVVVETAPTEPEAAADAADTPILEEAASAYPIERPPIEPVGDEAETPIVAEAASPGPVESLHAEPAVDGAERPVDAEAPPAEDEWIEVWRPAPRRRPQPVSRPAPGEHRGANEADARAARPARDARRRWPRDEAARPQSSVQEARPETEPAATVETPAPVASEAPRETRRHEGAASHRQERGRRSGHKGSRPEEARTPESGRGAKDPSQAPAKKDHRPTPVDMDSPFAKLLALKPLLERRDKRT